MIIFGTRASHIGSFEINDSTCDYCQNTGTRVISEFGQYFHIFWIPVFPIGKKTIGECAHCRRTLRKKEFSIELKRAYNEVKSAVKRPVWHWSGLILLGLLILLSIFVPRT